MKNSYLKNILSARKYEDAALLFLRLFVGCMMLLHGWAKFSDFDTLSFSFPDPLGIGSKPSLILILCTEIGCSLLLIFGLVTRLATLPLIFGMCMAIFVIHVNDPFQIKEPAVLYLGMYIVLLITGGGRYSLDYAITNRF